MGLLIVRHKVKDFAAWKKAFDGERVTESCRVNSGAFVSLSR